MTLKFPAALAAAVLLAGAVLTYSVPAACGSGSFSAPSFSSAPHFSAPHSFSVPHGAGHSAFHGNNFQRFRTNHITKYQLGNGHFKSHKVTKGATYSKSAGKKPFIAQKYSPGSKLSVQKLSSNQSFRKASITKHNVWSNKIWGGKEWHHHHDHWYRWYGPVFWPYFFGDYFCYGFWPDDCDDIYWGYGPDAILWGAFWPAGE